MENREIVSVGEVKPFLLTQAQELEKLVAAKQKALSKSPKGKLQIRICRGSVQWYCVDDNFKEAYLPKDDESEARLLAQKSYDKKVLDEACRSLVLIKKFLKNYNPDVLFEIFEKMHPARQELVKPIRLSDDDYIKQWLAVQYSGRPFGADSSELYTSLKIRVRSKSEVIIADALTHYGVPYRYEYPYKMKTPKGALRICPDFTCLNVRARREFVWEHFGLIDNVEYAKNMADKMEMYAENGYYEGVNLITTYETAEKHLSSHMVSLLIENVLLR